MTNEYPKVEVTVIKEIVDGVTQDEQYGLRIFLEPEGNKPDSWVRGVTRKQLESIQKQLQEKITQALGI